MPDSVKVAISTSSRTIHWPLPKPQEADLPKISLNDVAIAPPAQGPYTPTGYRVVVIDATQDITDPASVTANEYVSLDGYENTNWWRQTYPGMYQQVLDTILGAGNIFRQLFFVMSFGLDENMTPTTGCYQYLLEQGAGAQLQLWEKTADSGSQVSNSESWTSYPANYILIGGSAYSYGGGDELHQTGDPVKSTLTVTLEPH